MSGPASQKPSVGLSSRTVELRLYRKIKKSHNTVDGSEILHHLIRIYPTSSTGFLHILSVVWPWDF